MYIDKLKNDVQSILRVLAPHIQLEDADRCGAWVFRTEDKTKAVYATPFFDGDCALPIEIISEDGELLMGWDAGFVATENPERDALYIVSMVQAAWIVARTMN